MGRRNQAVWSKDEVYFDAVLHHGDSDQLRAVYEQAAQRAGAIVGINGLSHGETNVALERLAPDRSQHLFADKFAHTNFPPR